jgi:hypothetical protein
MRLLVTSSIVRQSIMIRRYVSPGARVDWHVLRISFRSAGDHGVTTWRVHKRLWRTSSVTANTERTRLSLPDDGQCSRQVRSIPVSATNSSYTYGRWVTTADGVWSLVARVCLIARLTRWKQSTSAGYVQQTSAPRPH